MHQQQTVFENIVRKGEIARNEQFLLFPQCFLLNQIIVSPFVHIFDTMSLFATQLEEPKIGISGKGLNMHIFNTINEVYFKIIQKSRGPFQPQTAYTTYSLLIMFIVRIYYLIE